MDEAIEAEAVARHRNSEVDDETGSKADNKADGA
jgi:hypothetical protein